MCKLIESEWLTDLGIKTYPEIQKENVELRQQNAAMLDMLKRLYAKMEKNNLNPYKSLHYSGLDEIKKLIERVENE